jgi:hypothetical protein
VRKSKSRSSDSTPSVYQLRVTVDGIDPPIWRRVEVEDYDLDVIHHVIQYLFEWDHEHPHAFYRLAEGRRQGGEAWDAEQAVRLSDVVQEGHRKFLYQYKLGDSWYHTVEIEAAVPADPAARYPRCIEGRRAGPMEECGGPAGWQRLIEAAENADAGCDVRWQSVDPQKLDPEAFDLSEVNQRLEQLRAWLADHMPATGQAAFSPGDRVRVKAGAVHPEYPDLPLGGWAGTVESVGDFAPRRYRVWWTPETLGLAHPIYAKRCRRDGLDLDETWLDEDQLLADPGGPVLVEDPVDLQARPLSADDSEDRIRAALGLTGDDPLPSVSPETLRVYREYLVRNLRFPFEVETLSESDATEIRRATAIGLRELSENAKDLEFDVRDGATRRAVRLDRAQCADPGPNAELVDDYREWFYEHSEQPHHAEPDEDDLLT